MVAERTIYEFVTIAPAPGPVRASNGVLVTPDYTIADAPDIDALLVVGPNPIPTHGVESVVRWLKRLVSLGVPVGGVDTGSYFLALAGLLDGYRCTIHWEDMSVLTEAFPRLVVSPNLFEVDRNRCSCSGGIAAVDMMIHLVALGHGGRELAAAISELLICERRGPEERQRIPLKALVGSMNPKLSAAVTLMEANIEEPLSLAEVAMHVGLSSRHLERLFRDSVASTPSHFYLRLRLEKARHLVLKTERPLCDIAAACGFVSIAHFTNRYGTQFGQTPSVARRHRAHELRNRPP